MGAGYPSSCSSIAKMKSITALLKSLSIAAEAVTTGPTDGRRLVECGSVLERERETESGFSAPSEPAMAQPSVLRTTDAPCQDILRERVPEPAMSRDSQSIVHVTFPDSVSVDGEKRTCSIGRLLLAIDAIARKVPRSR